MLTIFFTQTVSLKGGKATQDFASLELAMHHRELRSKRNIKKYQTLAKRLVAKQVRYEWRHFEGVCSDNLRILRSYLKTLVKYFKEWYNILGF